MAEKLNVDQSVYARLEQGETNTWAKYFEELFKIFEITPKDFFSDIGNQVINQNNYKGSSGYIVENLYQEKKIFTKNFLLPKMSKLLC